jgi:hypothetical protein
MKDDWECKDCRQFISRIDVLHKSYSFLPVTSEKGIDGAAEAERQAIPPDLGKGCQGQHLYRTTTEQPYPRRCVECGEPEPVPDLTENNKANSTTDLDGLKKACSGCQMGFPFTADDRRYHLTPFGQWFPCYYNTPKHWFYDLNIRIALDGSDYTAHYADFKNLQESPAGYGATPEDAVRQLLSTKVVSVKQHARAVDLVKQCQHMLEVMEARGAVGDDNLTEDIEQFLREEEGQ